MMHLIELNKMDLVNQCGIGEPYSISAGLSLCIKENPAKIENIYHMFRIKTSWKLEINIVLLIPLDHWINRNHWEKKLGKVWCLFGTVN